MLHSRYTKIVRSNIYRRDVSDLLIATKCRLKKYVIKDGLVSIHSRNMQSLAIGMYKVKSELAPMITTNVFSAKPEDHYDLRNHKLFAGAVYHGTESISYLGPKI